MPLLTKFLHSLKKEKDKNDETIEEQINKLSNNLKDVSLANTRPSKPEQPPPVGSRFPGGFHPSFSATTNDNAQSLPSNVQNGVQSISSAAAPLRFPVPNQYPDPPGPLPRPPNRHNSRKEHISKTLEYAMQGIAAYQYPSPIDTPTASKPPHRLHAPPLPPRPHSDPTMLDVGISAPLPSPQPSHSNTTPSKHDAAMGSDTSPSRPVRGRRRNSSASSVPSVSISKNGAVRCSGITKSGAQCKNMVKDSAALGNIDPQEHETMTRYCHVHTDQIKKSGGYLNNNIEAPFKKFISDSLEPQTQVQLKTLMVEKVSNADREGYIYIYEVQDSNRLHTDILEFKVGRSYKPIQRVGQWENSCRSQRHIVRYIFPEPLGQIMLTGVMRQGQPTNFCHRLERLIHLELADLSLNAAYLEPQDKDHVHALATRPRTRCVDCKKLHQEIFSFRRARSGPYKSKEYEMVKGVVDKWGEFVNEYLLRSS